MEAISYKHFYYAQHSVCMRPCHGSDCATFLLKLYTYIRTLLPLHIMSSLMNTMNAGFVQSMTSLQHLLRPSRTASTLWRGSSSCTTRPSMLTMQDSKDMSSTFACMLCVCVCACVCVCVSLPCTRF